MKKKTNQKEVELGIVSVDSGQLIIMDPGYIDPRWITPEYHSLDFAHEIYEDADSELYQFNYGTIGSHPKVKTFANYNVIIPKYNDTVNNLIQKGILKRTGMDARPHIAEDEFSYRAICKKLGDNVSAEFYHVPSEIPGLAVAFRSGFGDGTYRVTGIVEDFKNMGERLTSVTITLIEDDEN